MDQTLHPNSHRVTIFQAGSFLERAQGKEISDYYEQSKVSIGSYWESNQSTKVGSGLSFPEQGLLMPIIINADADDKGFREAVANYFHEKDTKIPYHNGMVLEIGLERNNDKPIAKDNMPLNPHDFVTYRHALHHPETASSKKEAESNPLKRFYIYDPLEMKTKDRKSKESKDSAMQIYLMLKNEPQKVDQMLVLLGKDVREYRGVNAAADKIDDLRTFSEVEPDKFCKLYKLNDLEVRYWVEHMAKLGVFIKIGEKYIDADTKRTIGHNMEEAISYFLDAENSQHIVVLKARMQEAETKPIVKGLLKTELTAKQIK